MGRGRAKAKQTKVARELKYRAGSGTDLDALRAELVHTRVDGSEAPVSTVEDDSDDDPYEDPYAVYAVDDDESDDEDDLARRWNVS